MQSHRNPCRSELVVCVALEVVGLMVAAALPGCGGNDASDSGRQITNPSGVKRPGADSTGSSTSDPNADDPKTDGTNVSDPSATGPSATTPNATGPNASGPSAPGQGQTVIKANPHPAWVVGTYENPGKIDNNILSGQRSITFAADGTYTGFYCKSCGNEAGKWTVNDGKLVLDGGSFGGTITLATDLTPNCRILDYMSQQFYRDGVVPDCPLGGHQVDAQACSFVGTYQVTGTGNVSDSALVSVEPDYFWYHEKTHIYCVTNQYGSKCLNTTTYDFGTWSVVDGILSGAPTSGLTFMHADCATFGAASNGSGGATSGGNGGSAGKGGAGGADAGSSTGGSAGGGSGGASASGGGTGGSSGGSAGGNNPDGGAGASSAGGGSGGSASSVGGRSGASAGAGGSSG